MNVFEMVAIIVVFGVVGTTLQKWFSTKSKSATKTLNTEAQARIKALEERTAVLERLATSKSGRLRDEIDAL